MVSTRYGNTVRRLGKAIVRHYEIYSQLINQPISFLKTTLKNLTAGDGKIAISVYDPQSLEGYQVKGKAEYVTEGEVVSAFKTMVEKMFVGNAAGYIRLNLAMPRSIIKTGLDRMTDAIEKHNSK